MIELQKGLILFSKLAGENFVIFFPHLVFPFFHHTFTNKADLLKGKKWCFFARWQSIKECWWCAKAMRFSATLSRCCRAALRWWTWAWCWVWKLSPPLQPLHFQCQVCLYLFGAKLRGDITEGRQRYLMRLSGRNRRRHCHRHTPSPLWRTLGWTVEGVEFHAAFQGCTRHFAVESLANVGLISIQSTVRLR